MATKSNGTFNICAVVTQYSNELHRMVAYAIKFNSCENVAAKAKAYETMMICRTWKEAWETASDWDKGFCEKAKGGM